VAHFSKVLHASSCLWKRRREHAYGRLTLGVGGEESSQLLCNRTLVFASGSNWSLLSLLCFVTTFHSLPPTLQGLTAHTTCNQCNSWNEQIAGQGAPLGSDVLSIRQLIHTTSGSEQHNCQSKQVPSSPCAHADLVTRQFAERQTHSSTYKMV